MFSKILNPDSLLLILRLFMVSIRRSRLIKTFNGFVKVLATLRPLGFWTGVVYSTSSSVMNFFLYPKALFC